jgi:hypothetical protein
MTEKSEDKNDTNAVPQLSASAATFHPATVSEASQKRGRLQAPIWKMFTDDCEPHLKKSTCCKHCKGNVTYHKKSEYVQSHLRQCKAFKKLMMSMDIIDRPEWFQVDKKVKLNAPLASADSSFPRGTQSKMVQYTLPAMSAKLNTEFQETMALHYYITGTAFQRIEDENLVKAIKMLRPDAVLPDRKKLSGVLLDKCYNNVKKLRDSYMKSASSSICLTTDGWSNIRNEPIVNYMANSPSKTIFLESVTTGIQGHTAEWIAADIDRVMNKYPDTKFAGVVTDNASAYKSAWQMLKQRHPTMFFHGCVSHGLHLMVKDTFAATKTKKAGLPEPTYPEGYPFEEMLQLAVDCKDLVKFFHNHHVMKTRLTQMQMADKLCALKQPASTRWGTLQQCFKTILDSERLIYSITTERDFIAGTVKQKAVRQHLRDIVTKDNFICLLEKALKILEPINALIVKFQSDSVPVSEVVTAFNNIPNEFQSLTAWLTAAEIKYLKQLASNRFEFMYGDAHGMGYLLDPRFVGDGLPAEIRRQVEDLLVSIPEDGKTASTEERKMELHDQLTRYVIAALREKNENSIRFKMLQMKRKTPLQFWQSDGTAWPELQKIALNIFTMSTSSASSERNFSTFGFVHSKLRNSLSQESVEKLVFIKTNHRALTDGTNLEFELSDNEQSENSASEIDSDAENI